MKTMPQLLKDCSEPQVIEAIEANFLETFPWLGRTAKGQTYDSPELLWYTTGVPFPFHNMVLRTRLAPGEVNPKIRATMDVFKAHQLPMFWFVCPSTQPADLGARLESCGLIYAEDATGMAVDLAVLNTEKPCPPGLVIKRVNDLETFETWVDTFTTGYGVPAIARDPILNLHAQFGFEAQGPWHYYLALLQGEPVATSWLALGAGVAGLYGVTTLPGWRRQGIGGAVTLAPLLDARRMGYQIGILQSSAMAIGLYRSLGFREYCRFSAYLWSGDDVALNR